MHSVTPNIQKTIIEQQSVRAMLCFFYTDLTDVEYSVIDD